MQTYEFLIILLLVNLTHALRITVPFSPNVLYKYYTESKQGGINMNLSFSNLKDTTPVSVKCYHIDYNGNRNKNEVFSYYESTKEPDDGFLTLYPGFYEIVFEPKAEMLVEIDLYLDSLGKLDDKDMIEKDTGVSNLKDTLNKLKKDLADLRSRIKYIMTRENRSMITIESVDSRIRSFSIFEVLLMVVLPLGSVYILKTYFQNHLKKGVA